MIERIIKALGDTSLKTRVKFYPLTPGEIIKAQFKDEKDYETLLLGHAFEAATEAQLIDYQKSFIPIIPSESETNIFTPEEPIVPQVVDNKDVTPVEKEKVIETVNLAPTSNVRSRCSKCGRVKPKDAELCKQCASDIE